jgi:hypothetical protein
MKIPLNYAFIGIIIFAVVLLIDSQLLPPKPADNVVGTLDTKFTSTKTSSFTNYFLITTSDKKYEITETAYDQLAEQDSIRILSSRIFTLPLKMQLKKGGHTHTFSIGQMGRHSSLKYGLIFVIVALSLFLLLKHFINEKYARAFSLLRIIPVGVFLVILIFIVIEQASI